jgi:ABC-2 type transport system permease protein
MNASLFKFFIKSNWKVWLIIAAILAACLVMIVSMYDIMSGLGELLESMGLPPEVADALGGFDSALTYFSIVFFTEDMTFMFGIIYGIIIAYKLMYKPVDSTSLGSFLTAGISRKSYVATAGVFMLASMFALFLVIFALGGLLLLMWGSYDFVAFTNLIVSTSMVAMVVAMVSFFFASIMAGNKLGFLLIIGLPVLFALLSVLSGMATQVEFLRWFSPYGWIDTLEIARGTFDLWWMWQLICATVIGVLLTLSIVLFDKKQLSI